MQDVALIIAVVGVIIFLAHLFTGIFNRLMIPDVLFLIVIGISKTPTPKPKLVNSGENKDLNG
jgi:Kef-type K+ transport system membrane component KefB